MNEEAKGDGYIIALKTLEFNSQLISLALGLPSLTSAHICVRACVRASWKRVHPKVTHQQQGCDDRADYAAAAAAGLVCP